MEPSHLIKYSVWLLIVSVIMQSYTSRCCLEDEKVALLQLKSYLKSLSASPTFTKYLSNELTSWNLNNGINCCLWNRVTCNRFTQHVTGLYLHSITNLVGNNVVLNISLFQPFRELMSLDLSFNSIKTLVGNGGHETLRLRNLEILDFGVNELDLQEIADFVGSLTSLKKLFLNSNHLVGNIPGKELSYLKKLQVLDLGSNRLNGSLPTGLCKLRNLQELILQFNLELSGSIPGCFWNLTSLRVVDLSNNKFSGKLPPRINLPSLEWLTIHDNNFEGRFSLCHLMNHSKLEGLLLSNNALQLEIEDSSCSSTSNHIHGLGISKGNLSGQSDTLFKFLSYQSNLQYIDLSGNGLTGLFPEWLLQNSSNLKYLNLRNNLLSGNFKLPKNKNLSSLSYLDVSINKLEGNIPEGFGMALSSLQILNMSSNSLQGHIPTSTGNMTLLYALDLSSNNFSGQVPRQMFVDCTRLEYLFLSNNNLEGEFVPSNINSTSLAFLELDGNNLGASTKGTLNISLELDYLDISNNRATGKLPSWIANMGSLSLLSLALNEFHGEIPCKLCNLKRLYYLDLSENMFTGEIPSCVGRLPLNFLHMHGNLLTGSIPEGLAGCSNHLLTLDLENNKLSGRIPQWIDKLSSLVMKTFDEQKQW